MSSGISGPRAVPLTLVLHLWDHTAVLQRELLRHRASICDDIAEGKVPGEGGFVEFLGLAQRGDLLVGEALHVVDAAEDALDRGVGVRYPKGRKRCEILNKVFITGFFSLTGTM